MKGLASLRDRARAPRVDGAAAIVFLLMLPVMLGFIGLALDLAQLYNRKLEMQSVADAAAIAAAGELVGTSTGITNAVAQAAIAAGRMHYQYKTQSVVWSDAAIKFSATPSAPDSGWVDAGAAQAAPDGLLFAKVDTSALAAETSAVTTMFMGVLAPSLATASANARAIAGRTSIMTVPLGICAMSPAAATSRSNAGAAELIEYGFRRGVSYNLMQLNPNASTPENFLLDPIDPPGTVGPTTNMVISVVAPFVCAGSMPLGRIAGGALTVQRPFPLSQLYQQLNSRFDQFPVGLCDVNAAPPDFNVKSYLYNTAIPWMSTSRNGQAADIQIDPTKLWTKADLAAPNSNTAPVYGPLWSYAKAVPYAAYTPGVPEPAGGYSTFPASAWSTLYVSGPPTANAYPATPPYSASGGANFLAPSSAHKPGLRNRRVLNIPLLSCPVPAGATSSATVLGIGKFFMTVPATATSIYAEFAGAVPEQALSGPVVLYP